MRKHLPILVVLLAFCLSGCGKVNESIELPVPDYPLSKDFISEAIEKSNLPKDLLIKENDYSKIEGVKTSFYSIEHPIEEGMPPYLAHCMGLLSHKSDEFSSVGLTISSIDQDRENFSEEEMKKAICFATYLFWGQENDTRIYDAFMKDYVIGKQIIWEKEIDGIDCLIKHDPESITAIFNISFSTDMEAQLSTREDKVETVNDNNPINEGILYSLTVNKEAITKSNMQVEPGDIIFAITENMNDDIVDGTVEGNYLSTELHEAIIDIDYPTESSRRDGTVITSQEYLMKDVPAGQTIHVTITQELQERLGLESDVLEITVSK